jgi:Fibronectin type III domain
MLNSTASDAEVVSRATAVQTNMTGNANFPTPPVDLAALKTAIDSLLALMAEALDGSKKVVAEKNKQRHAVIKMVRLLGRYVEYNCKDDMAIFQSSGLQAASTTKNRTQPLSEKIRKLEHGANSGQIAVWLRRVRGASSYELHYGSAASGGGPPASWTTQIVTRVKAAVTLSGLTPGTTYVFQARALLKEGYTDWSDSVTLMCT